MSDSQSYFKKNYIPNKEKMIWKDLKEKWGTQEKGFLLVKFKLVLALGRFRLLCGIVILTATKITQYLYFLIKFGASLSQMVLTCNIVYQPKVVINL